MAERLRGQAAGLYVSKSEIRVGSIDSMSRADVEAALADLKKTMGEKIIEGSAVDAGSETVEGNPDGPEGDGPGDSSDSD
jgi:hypothetical protein